MWLVSTFINVCLCRIKRLAKWTQNSFDLINVRMKRFTISKMYLPSVAAVWATTLVLVLFVSGCATTSPQNSNTATPALITLPQFIASNVPRFGPDEIPIDQPNWKISPPDATLPGKGLAQHPM